MYTYIYIYVHIYIHIFIYIYKSAEEATNAITLDNITMSGTPLQIQRPPDGIVISILYTQGSFHIG